VSVTEGGFRIDLHVNVEAEELASWPPERVYAFFRGAALLISAKGIDVDELKVKVDGLETSVADSVRTVEKLKRRAAREAEEEREARGYKCSKCGETGHNAATCIAPTEETTEGTSSREETT